MGSVSLPSRKLYDILKGNLTDIERFISEIAGFIENYKKASRKE